MARHYTGSSLEAELESLLAGHGARLLVVKATADDAFAAILTALSRARPDAEVTSLVAGKGVGVEEEVGEVVRAHMGWRALMRRLGRGSDVCLVAADARRYGGVRRVLADVAALASHARLKVVCSPHQVLAVRGRTSIVLAPFGSAAALGFGVVAAVLMAAACLVLAVAGGLVGQAVLRLLPKIRRQG